MNPLVHADTKAALSALEANKPHACMLTGPAGVGLATVALSTAKKWGTILEVVRPTAKSKTSLPTISVETIRELYDRTRMKLTSSHVAVIDDADTMTVAAQNALLKLLEEPAQNVHFILTSHLPDSLLPTVRSRLQTVRVQPIDAASSVRLMRQLGVTDENIYKQLLFLANGLPAELSRLASDTSHLQKVSETVRLARDFVGGSAYERLVIIQKVASNRQDTLLFVDTVQLLLKKSINATADMRSIQLLDSLLSVKDLITTNANARLQLATTVV